MTDFSGGIIIRIKNYLCDYKFVPKFKCIKRQKSDQTYDFNVTLTHISTSI